MRGANHARIYRNVLYSQTNVSYSQPHVLYSRTDVLYSKAGSRVHYARARRAGRGTLGEFRSYRSRAGCAHVRGAIAWRNEGHNGWRTWVDGAHEWRTCMRLGTDGIQCCAAEYFAAENFLPRVPTRSSHH